MGVNEKFFSNIRLFLHIAVLVITLLVLIFANSILLSIYFQYFEGTDYMPYTVKKRLCDLKMHTSESQLSLLSKKACTGVPPNLVGPVEVCLQYDITIAELDQLHPELLPGGNFVTPFCRSPQKVGIIIPYRDREEHLTIFLNNIHNFLQRQQINYIIYVVEQEGNGTFNRAMLKNIGAAESFKKDRVDCFIFHDIDLVPEDDRNLYTCPNTCRHMSIAVNTLKYELPYYGLVGGVFAMNALDFLTINGFSNRFWGWGGEDDDLFNRINFYGYHIARYPAHISRYIMLSHAKDSPSRSRFYQLHMGKDEIADDGLNNMKYDILKFERRTLFTWVLTKYDIPEGM